VEISRLNINKKRFIIIIIILDVRFLYSSLNAPQTFSPWTLNCACMHMHCIAADRERAASAVATIAGLASEQPPPSCDGRGAIYLEKVAGRVGEPGGRQHGRH